MSAIPYTLLHEYSLGDPSVVIAVLDGPVDLAHSCFQGADITLLDTLATNTSASGIAAQHGTHVASIIFGQPGTTVEGIAPRCRGLIVPVFRGTETGGILPCSQLDLARAISQAVTHGANVINISAGQLDNSGQPEPLLESILKQCEDNNILVVAAAGNNGCDCVHVPAAYPSVLVVGGMDDRGEPLEFSNWGESYGSHGVLAQGQNVLGAVPGGGTDFSTGSSYAAPLVAGGVGILLSWLKQAGGGGDAKLVRTAILETAIDCEQQPTQECQRLLAGRINLQGAFQYLQQRKQINMSEQTECAGNQEEVAKNAAISKLPPEMLVQASGCGCGGNKDGGGYTSSLVYAIGKIDVDYASEANKDSFKAFGKAWKEGFDPTVSSQALAEFLISSDDDLFINAPPLPVKQAGETEEEFNVKVQQRNAEYRKRLLKQPLALTNFPFMEQVTWVLKQNDIPTYALVPVGSFSQLGFLSILEFFQEQVGGEADFVVLPGKTFGKTKLSNGSEVDLVALDTRGFCNWSKAKLLNAIVPAAAANREAIKTALDKYIARVQHEHHNLGTTYQDRALNYSITNLVTAKEILTNELVEAGRALDNIEVIKSRGNRPGAEAWDVKLTFFHPEQRHAVSRKVYLFTVDVSNIIPVRIGEIRSWEIY
jgi:Subtilase family/PatG C-terminal/PatG Domain